MSLIDAGDQLREHGGEILTLVTLAFEAAGAGTHLVLDQEPFKTKARGELHREGWTETLARLERFVS